MGFLASNGRKLAGFLHGLDPLDRVDVVTGPGVPADKIRVMARQADPPLDPAARAAEKQRSRDEDARSLRRGRSRLRSCGTRTGRSLECSLKGGSTWPLRGPSGSRCRRRRRLLMSGRSSGSSGSSPNTGVVVFVDSGGVTRKIDFLGTPLGLRAQDVRDTRCASPPRTASASG
jgi:hypothetical protein